MDLLVADFVKHSSIYNYDDNTLSHSHKCLLITKSVLVSESTKAITWFGDNKMQENPNKFQAIMLGKNESCQVTSGWRAFVSLVEIRGHSSFKIHIEEFVDVLIVKLNKSDHSVILFKFNSYFSNNRKPKERYLYDKADYNNMEDLLDKDWGNLLEGKDVNQQWSVFKKELQDCIDLCVPKLVIDLCKSTPKRHNLPINTKTKSMVKRKQRLWNKYLRTGDEQYKNQYNRLRNQVRKQTRRTIKNHEKKMLKM